MARWKTCSIWESFRRNDKLDKIGICLTVPAIEQYLL